MSNEPVLTAKEKSLISVSASVAAGCQPCTEHHVSAAHSAGACDRSITLAIETALGVRESATRSMAEWAARCQPVRPELDAAFREQKRLVAALAAFAAAVAVNSVPDVRERVEAARACGATLEQIRMAVAIAVSIRRTAAEKVNEILAGVERPEPAACCAPAAAPCGCGG